MQKPKTVAAKRSRAIVTDIVNGLAELASDPTCIASPEASAILHAVDGWKAARSAQQCTESASFLLRNFPRASA